MEQNNRTKVKGPLKKPGIVSSNRFTDVHVLYHVWTGYLLESVQDFLIKLGIKSRMHLWKINVLSLNCVIVRPTKIMNRGDKNWAHF